MLQESRDNHILLFSMYLFLYESSLKNHRGYFQTFFFFRIIRPFINSDEFPSF